MFDYGPVQRGNKDHDARQRFLILFEEIQRDMGLSLTETVWLLASTTQEYANRLLEGERDRVKR